mgnify:FL=1|tara:strand:+ start:269 stop:568 length:300 start_codon:yes stop_codon:yes gene_type:complete
MKRELTYDKWAKYIHDYQTNKYQKKIYVDNSKFMELVDDIATQLTELKLGDHTYKPTPVGILQGQSFTDDAQDYYNGTYDEIEELINNTINVFSNNDKN